MSTISMIEPIQAPIKLGNPSDSGGAAVMEGLIVAQGTNLGGGVTYVAIYPRGICTATWNDRHGGFYSTSALPCPGYQDVALRNYGIAWADYAELAADLAIYGENLTSHRDIDRLMIDQRTITHAA